MDTKDKNKILFDQRESQCKQKDNHGQLLVNWTVSHGLFILNGRFSSDFPANITIFSKNGVSVVDFGLLSATLIPYLFEFRIMNVILSDHFPICISLHRKILDNNCNPLNDTY